MSDDKPTAIAAWRRFLRTLVVVSTGALTLAGLFRLAIAMAAASDRMSNSDQKLSVTLAIVIAVLSLTVGYGFRYRFRNGQSTGLSRWLRFPLLFWLGLSFAVGGLAILVMPHATAEPIAVTVIIPALIGVQTIVIVRIAMWAFATTSSPAASGLSLGGAVGATLVLAVVALAEVEGTPSLLRGPRQAVAVAEAVGPSVQSLHAVPPAALPEIDATNRFNYCAETLAVSREGRLGVNEAQRWLIARSTAGPEEAEDIVYGTLLSVCSRFVRQEIADLNAYFFASIKNAARKNWRHLTRVADDNQDYCELQLVDPRGADRDLALDFQSAYCQLDASTQAMMEAALLRGLSYEELALACNRTEPAVRKRMSRAIRQLQAAIGY